jgi:hypothetical protein
VTRHDREYALFAKLPDADRDIQIAAWDPTVNAPPPSSRSSPHSSL